MEITEAEARELLSAPSGQRPRICADIVSGVYAGQRVAVRSVSRLEEYAGTFGRLWVSDSTVSDIVGRLGE